MAVKVLFVIVTIGLPTKYRVYKNLKTERTNKTFKSHKYTFSIKNSPEVTY